MVRSQQRLGPYRGLAEAFVTVRSEVVTREHSTPALDAFGAETTLRQQDFKLDFAFGTAVATAAARQ